MHKNERGNCGKGASYEINFLSHLRYEQDAEEASVFCIENKALSSLSPMGDKVLVTPCFAAERGGSLTELAAGEAENATNFFPRGRYTHGTAVMRRGSVARLSVCCDDA